MPCEVGEDEGGEAEEDHEDAVGLEGGGIVFEVADAHKNDGAPPHHRVKEQVEADVLQNEKGRDQPDWNTCDQENARVVEVLGRRDDEVKNENEKRAENHQLRVADYAPPNEQDDQKEQNKEHPHGLLDKFAECGKVRVDARGRVAARREVVAEVGEVHIRRENARAPADPEIAENQKDDLPPKRGAVRFEAEHVDPVGNLHFFGAFPAVDRVRQARKPNTSSRAERSA